jgi:hypothetical protein
MDKVVNLTPHTVRVFDSQDRVIAEYASTTVARAKQTNQPAGSVNGIPTVRTEFGAPEGLPEPKVGVLYIVSAITASAAKSVGRDTKDLLLTSDPVRGDDGSIIGCRAFARV